MITSPFIHGKIVDSAQFYNRHKDVRRLFNRLMKGESTAIIGQPHIGKTSLLNYVLDKGKQQTVIGNGLDKCIFKSLDVFMLGSFDQPAFWQLVLEPFVIQFPTGTVHDLYKTSQENKFGAFTLEKLFGALQTENWRLILLLDEFDMLLTHSVLNSVEFYGSLRSLASRYSSLALVITTRRSLDFLNQNTQALNPHGSPYFNIFTELRLGPLPQKDAADLLAQAVSCFDRHDRQFLFEISGLHPYLLQLAADCLWEAHHDGKRGNARYQLVANEIYEQTVDHFSDTWRAWSNAERKVVTAIALNQIPWLVEDRTFEQSALVQDLNDYSKELSNLKNSGTIIDMNDGQWRITQQAFLWWLADEIKRATRDDKPFEQWLEQHEFGELLTGREKEKWSQSVKTVTGVLSKGVATLVEAFAKGFGEGVGKTAAGSS